MSEYTLADQPGDPAQHYPARDKECRKAGVRSFFWCGGFLCHLHPWGEAGIFIRSAFARKKLHELMEN
jgi:hypothetical protein